jgi:hypothetical protein
MRIGKERKKHAEISMRKLRKDAKIGKAKNAR